MPQIKDIPITKTTADDLDYLVMQSPDGETYKIIKANFLAGLSSGGGGGNNSDVILTFESFGDAKGVFYYLGLNGGSTWSNPATIGKVNTSAIGVNNPSLPVTGITDRLEGNFHTTSTADPWVQFDLIDKKLKLTQWTYRARYDSTLYIPSRLIISGSLDGINYIQIDDKSFTLGVNAWTGNSTPGQATSYRYIQFTMPGSSYLTIGEIELYGVLS